MTTRRISSSRGIFRNCECATSRATISAWRTASRVSQNETFDSAARPSEAGDDGPFEPLGTFADLRDDEFRLGVVDLARGADQPRAFRRRGDDEPWIDGDAVSAHPRPGLQDSHPRMAVGELDNLPDIEPELIADQRQFVGKGDVDVAEGIFG